MEPEEGPIERIVGLLWSLATSESLTNILLGTFAGVAVTNIDFGWLYVEISNAGDIALIGLLVLTALTIYGYGQWLEMRAEQARREYFEPESDKGIY